MLLKQFKYKIEFLINVHDITDDTSDIVEDLLNNDVCLKQLEESSFMAYQKRQQRVLHALLADKLKLRKYLDRVVPELVTNDAGELIETFLSARDNNDDTDNIVNLIIETLPKEDQDFFKRADKEGCLAEHLELFCQAFALDISEMSLEEVK
jgi:hypothetical protein